jgi:hypothetical protein
MRNDLPPISLITGIANVEQEDYFAQLLFSRGWNILFRALCASDLTEFLAEKKSTENLLLLYSEDLISKEMVDELKTSYQIPAISISILPTEREELLRFLRDYLRNEKVTPRVVVKNRPPLIQSNSYAKPKNSQPLWVVTGVSGAVGKTFLTAALAKFACNREEVLIVDADIGNQSLNFFLGDEAVRNRRGNRNNLELVEMRPKEELNSILSESNSKLTLIDLGSALPSDYLAEDRRRAGKFQAQAFQLANKIIFTVSAKPQSMEALKVAIGELKEFAGRDKLVFVLNEIGSRHSLREIRKQFLELTRNCHSHTFPKFKEQEDRYPLNFPVRGLANREMEKFYQMLG